MGRVKTLVVGLGNPILTDDGVGVKVAYEVARQLDEGAQGWVDVTEASIGGLRLMEMMVGYDHVILIDAIGNEVNGARNPGRVHRMTLDDLKTLSPTQHSASAHDTSLATALEAGKKMDLPLPESYSIYAVEVKEIFDFGEEPTPPVAAAIPEVVNAVLDELRMLYV